MMKLQTAIRLGLSALALGALVCAPAVAADKTDPVADAKAFKKFFYDKFPKLKPEDFVNGPYSMDEGLHKQWIEKEQFPPYEFAVETGKEMFSKPFKNGKTYEDCFPNKGIGIRQNYPTFDDKQGKVITLELALNLAGDLAAAIAIGFLDHRPDFRWRPASVSFAVEHEAPSLRGSVGCRLASRWRR